MEHSPLMAIIPDESGSGFITQLATSMGLSYAEMVVGSPVDAISTLNQLIPQPRYLVIDIGDRASDILAEIDALAEHCEAGVRVVVIGSINDVHFYRELKQRGIAEYFPRPANSSDIRNALVRDTAPASKSGSTVISFMSATSGDGSSTVALNTAYSIAQEFKKPTVLIDMDFQFGMVAKNLDVSAPFGIKEIFEHPDRGIDSTLTQRMLVGYGDHLKIISAPNDLRLMPDVRPELVRDLIFTLREQYQYIIIDMPHLWTLWTATAFTNSTHNVLVSQLWLRSVTHASRILNAWREAGVEEDSIAVTVNRSGAKFKEAVSIKDFERVCNKPVSAFFSNDIKTVVTAENRGKTVFEIEPSPLAKQIRDFARGFLPNAKHSQNTGGEHASPVKSVKSSLFSKK